jgi:orotate phosphoribosyltransferase
MSREFIEFALENGALWLSGHATRTLKSGRMSPYFFDSSKFSSGKALDAIGRAYGDALMKSNIGFDVLFGPPYKGIPLATAVSTTLYKDFGIDVEVAFNRKEAKDHGEGGRLIGKSLMGKSVMVIDDVITRGDAKYEAHQFIKENGGTLAGIVIAFDRQERGESGASAIHEVERRLNTWIISSTSVTDLIRYLRETGRYHEALAAIEKYQGEYGVSA